MVDQEIKDGWQVEKPDEWLRLGNPWEVARPEYGVPVRFGGHAEEHADDHGRLKVHWTGGEQVVGMPYDTPVAGDGYNTGKTLRLLRARAAMEFSVSDFYHRGNEKKRAYHKRCSR